MSVKLVITYRLVDYGTYVASIDDLQLFANGQSEEEAKENLLKNLSFHITNFGEAFLKSVEKCRYEVLDYEV